MSEIEIRCDKCGGRCEVKAKPNPQQSISQAEWASRGAIRFTCTVYRPKVEVCTCTDCGHSVTRSDQTYAHYSASPAGANYQQ